MKLKWAGLMVVFFLSGCAVGMQPWQERALIKQGASVDYVWGYRDGCVSGEHSAGYVYARFQKNFQAHKTRADYREGWGDGFRICEQRFHAVRDLTR